MSSIPGVGGSGAGGVDPIRRAMSQQAPSAGVDPGTATPGFERLMGAGQSSPADAAAAKVAGDPLLASLREAAQQGLTPNQALESVVRKELDALAGGSAPPEMVQQVLESIRNDPSMSRILERMERATGQTG